MKKPQSIWDEVWHGMKFGMVPFQFGSKLARKELVKLMFLNINRDYFEKAIWIHYVLYI